LQHLTEQKRLDEEVKAEEVDVRTMVATSGDAVGADATDVSGVDGVGTVSAGLAELRLLDG